MRVRFLRSPRVPVLTKLALLGAGCSPRLVVSAIGVRVAGSAPETLNARGGTVRRGSPSGHVALVPVKCEPSVGANRVSLGAGLGNEAMQPRVN